MNFFEVIIYVALWSLMSKDSSDTYRLIAYFTLYYGLLNNIHTSKTAGWIANAINTGDLNNFLVKPINFPLLQVIRTITVIIVRTLVPIVILILGCIFFPQIFAPLSLLNFLAFLLFVLLGVIIWNLLTISISTLAFRGAEISSTLTVLDLLINLFKGAYIPAFYFPAWLTKVLSFTFIPYLASYPIKLYQETINYQELMFSFAVALAWIAFLGFTAVYFYKLGLKRYEASGS